MATEQLGRRVPWVAPDLVRLYVLNAAGLTVLVLGWLGASGTARLSRQVAWTALAVAGLLVAAAGHLLWLLAGRRAVGLRRHQLLSDATPSRLLVTKAARSGFREQKSEERVAVRGLGMYHRPDCVLVRGKAVRPVKPQGQRTPCPLCRP